MVVRMAIAVMMVMARLVTVRMVVIIMMMQPLARTRAARVFAEHERFDGHRHGVGRHADAAEIDIVEIPQHHAVDDQKFARRRASSSRRIWPRVCATSPSSMMKTGSFLRDAVGKAALDALGKGEKPLVRRHAGPAQRQRDLAFAFLRRRTPRCGCGLPRRAFPNRWPRRIRTAAAAPEDCGAATACRATRYSWYCRRAARCIRRRRARWRGCIRRPAGPARESAALDARADGAAESRAHVAEITIFALINVFGDAAGEHDAVDAAEIGDRIGQIKMFDVVRHRPRRQAQRPAYRP